MANSNPKTDHLKKYEYKDKGIGTLRGKAPIALRLPKSVEKVLEEIGIALKPLKLSRADYLRLIIYDRLKADGIWPDAAGKIDHDNLAALIRGFEDRNH